MILLKRLLSKLLFAADAGGRYFEPAFSMDDCNKFRWLGVEVCKDGKFGSELLCVKSAISPRPSFILDDIISRGDCGEIFVMGRMSPDLVTSN